MRPTRTRLALVTLLACGAFAPAPATAFEGRYTTGAAAYEQALTVTKTRTGFRGKAWVATRGCVGEFDGYGEVQGETLLLHASLDGRECRLTLRRSGPAGVQVEEEGCLAFHGAACEFSGSYKRQAVTPE